MSRWFINRVGLLNFWYYQKQIFQLADGRMLLRGSNGSGKSLTMQSLFPVLFDGNTSAYRLDSFGSRDRKMEDYLLGEKGVSTKDEGTGYLFMEVKREDREEYLTVGIGMNAHRGERLKKWFFALENNQRIGKDFHLYEEKRKDELTPLSKKQLINRLEGIGRFIEKQGEYKEYVNERIFGFDRIEQFDELITLLINLRSPKLSKDFSPSVIYGILRDSLPKLKDDELLPLAKTIEQIDGHRERLEDLNREIKELNSYVNTHQKWKKEYLGQVAEKWLGHLNKKNHFSSLQQELEKAQIATEGKMNELLKNEKENNFALESLTQNIQELSQHDGMDLVQRGQELKDQLEDITKRLENTRRDFKRKQHQLTIQRDKFQVEELTFEKQINELDEILLDNKQYVPYLGFEEMDETYSQKIKSFLSEDEFKYWLDTIQKKKDHFQQALKMLRISEEFQQKIIDLEKEEGEIQQQIDEFERDMAHWQQIRLTEVENWKNKFSNWAESLPFEMEENHYASVMYQIDKLLEEKISEEVVFEGAANSYNHALLDVQKECVGLKQDQDDLKKESIELENEITEWEGQKIPSPPQSEDRKGNRENLEGKTYISFYEAVDFKDEISASDRTAIEGALYASGILDSLISVEGLILNGDQQILPQPKFFSPTLVDFLKLEVDLDSSLQAVTMDILQSILVDEEDEILPSIYRNGSYKLSNLKGKMPLNYQASYIGAASQEQFRQRKIEELTRKRQMIEDRIQTISQRIDALVETQNQYKKAYEQKPSGDMYMKPFQIKRQFPFV